MKLRMLFRRLCILSCLFTFSFFMVLISAAQDQDIEVETVRFQETYDVPVVESKRQLITGVRIESFLEKYVPDLDDFEYEFVGGYYGLVAHGRVKPDPNDPETRFFWGSKRHLPFYKRRWGISIGVYKSHRDALLAASRYYKNRSALKEVNPLDKDNPGFVSWGEGKWVIDNVFAGFSSGDILDKKEIRTALKQGLLHGAEWVIKGDKPIPPQIQGENFPSEFSLWIDRKVEAELNIIEPNGLKVYRNIHARNLRGYKKEYEPSVFGTGLTERFPIHLKPLIKWKSPDIVQITQNGAVTFDLETVAVNNLCVVSDVFKKEIRISVPEE